MDQGLQGGDVKRAGVDCLLEPILKKRDLKKYSWAQYANTFSLGPNAYFLRVCRATTVHSLPYGSVLSMKKTRD